MSFWVKFAINEGIVVAETFVASGAKLTDDQKGAVIKFIEAGRELLSKF